MPPQNTHNKPSTPQKIIRILLKISNVLLVIVILGLALPNFGWKLNLVVFAIVALTFLLERFILKRKMFVTSIKRALWMRAGFVFLRTVLASVAFLAALVVVGGGIYH